MFNSWRIVPAPMSQGLISNQLLCLQKYKVIQENAVKRTCVTNIQMINVQANQTKKTLKTFTEVCQTNVTIRHDLNHTDAQDE